MTIEKATIRRVWEPNYQSSTYTVIVQKRGDFHEMRLWTKDAWLASLADRYADAAKRPEVTVMFDDQTHQLTSVVLPVAA